MTVVTNFEYESTGGSKGLPPADSGGAEAKTTSEDSSEKTVTVELYDVNVGVVGRPESTTGFPYLDELERINAESARAKVEGRDADYSKPSATAGTYLVPLAQALVIDAGKSNNAGVSAGAGQTHDELSENLSKAEPMETTEVKVADSEYGINEQPTDEEGNVVEKPDEENTPEQQPTVQPRKTTEPKKDDPNQPQTQPRKTTEPQQQPQKTTQPSQSQSSTSSKS